MSVRRRNSGRELRGMGKGGMDQMTLQLFPLLLELLINVVEG